VAVCEKIELSDNVISTIQTLYKSDIRSMINFIQLHKNIDDWERIIITDDVFEKIHQLLMNSTPISQIKKYIFEISIQYNTDKRNIIKDYSHFLIKTKPEIITSEILDIFETVIHSVYSDMNQTIIYFLNSIQKILLKKV
jgi:DNA polymerase III delta prime subunit